MILNSDFFIISANFAMVSEAKMDAKIDYLSNYFRCFFRARFGIYFESSFGGLKLKKSSFPENFISHKIDVFKKCSKSIDFGCVFGINFQQFYMFFNAFLDMRAAVVATPLLFTDVRFTPMKNRFVTTLDLNRHYYFNLFLISAPVFNIDF